MTLTNDPAVRNELEEIALLLEVAERAYTIAGFRFAKGTDNIPGGRAAKLIALGDSAITSVFRIRDDIQ